MYLSPVAYPAPSLHGVMSVLYGVNPLVGVIGGFRWALLGGPAPSSLIAVSSVSVAVLLVSGLYYFKRMERLFADVI